MIGSGIFTAPMALASSAGPAGIITYIIVVIGVWCMALSFAQLARLFPQEGSFYTYTKAWLGHTGGLLIGYLYILGLIISTGLLTRIALMYMPGDIVNMYPHSIGFALLAALVATYAFGLQIAGAGQYILATCTLFPLLATIIICLLHADSRNMIPFAPNGIGGIFSAMRIVIFGFFGFEFSTSLYNIIENPAKNVPRTLSSSILIVGILYTLFVAAIMLAIPLHRFNMEYMPLSTIIAALFPSHLWLAKAIHISIISAVLGTMHAILWTSSNLLQALVKNTVLIRNAISHTFMHSHFIWTCMVALAVAVIFAVVDNINLFFNLAAITMVTPYLCALLTLFFVPQSKRWSDYVINSIAVITAGTIIFFAAQDILDKI